LRATVPISPDRGFSFDRDTLLWIATGLVILATMVFLFDRGLILVARQWSDPEYSHGWLIPVVTLFILWSRRGPILAERGSGAWLGVALVALALGVLLLAEMAFVRRGPFLAMIALLIGLGYAALGRRAMRWALLPLLFLIFAFPLPGSVYVPLTTKLQLISSEIGAFMLRAMGISVYLDGNVIDLGSFQLQVAEACSGLRYLFPLASFGFLCAWLYRAPFWAKGLVLLSVVPITIVTNSGRIALTGVFMELGYEDLAQGLMHDIEGWMIFIVALSMMFALMWLLARLTGRRGGLAELLDFDRLNGTMPAAAAPAPRAVPAPLLACALLLVVAAVAYQPLTARAQTIPDRPGLVTFPLRVGDWSGQPIPIDDDTVLEGLGADDYLLVDFATAGALAPVNLWVAYYDEQLNDAGIHSPKDCLPGGGWEYVSIAAVPSPVAGLDGRPFTMNRGLIAKGREQMVIYYWLELRGRKMTNDTVMKLVNLWDSFRLGRSDGALVRVMTPVLPGEAVEDADARARTFIRDAYPVLEPHVGA
jgi:exosortase D (VPLPA-CTERM-specific)